MNLDVKASVEQGVATIAVAGEVDVSNADLVRNAIDAQLAAHDVAQVVIDLAGVPYIDSTGIGVLVGSSHRAHEAGKGFEVVAVQPNVARILGLLGVDEVLGAKTA